MLATFDGGAKAPTPKEKRDEFVIRIPPEYQMF
jgi:hypothetical protein